MTESAPPAQSAVALSRPPAAHVLRALGWVFLGGCLGTALRVIVSSSFSGPPGTFAVNCVGSLALGCLLGYLTAAPTSRPWHQRVRLCVGTGLMGGLTTYSTFIFEVLRLTSPQLLNVPAAHTFGMTTGGYLSPLGVGYLAVSFGAGLLLALLGLAAGRRWAQRTRLVPSSASRSISHSEEVSPQ